MPVDYEKKGRIAVITINRPEAMNALDRDMTRRLVEAWTEFRDDDDLWVAILTGAGEKSFCAGADLKEMGEYNRRTTPEERIADKEKNPGFGGITRNLEIWKPIVAGVNGYCFGGGFELALSCDIRIAAEGAKFGLTELRWGIIPGAGGTQRLPRAVGTAKALEMILLGRRIDAEEALRLGLVARVVPRGELMAACMETAEEICKNAPLAARAAKEAVVRGADMPLAEGLRLEASLAEPLKETEDAQEGPLAFKEKREPEFKAK
ncbi:MAG: enoyl-CoA hydratase-related protein [bacterium]